MSAGTPGWYPDPANPTRVRWFDGQTWTDRWYPREMNQQADILADLPPDRIDRFLSAVRRLLRRR